MNPFTLTTAQVSALRWLSEHGGTGVFDRNSVFFAQGQTAGVMKATWNALRKADLIVADGKRLTITPYGKEFLNGKA